ncbi:MAG: RNase adapter RapZ [Coriobacteriia bacterium]|nr:RNase adapter RapZ [Coriobacteriia bacterium]
MENAAAELTNEVISEDKIKSAPELVILTGMSGAGRTEAMHVFEDLGYFCIDNLPAGLLGQVMDLKGQCGSDSKGQRLAVVCDARNRAFFNGLGEQIAQLKARGVNFNIVFLDAADEKLVARYKSSRRRHPLCENGQTIAQGIRKERSLLYNLREAAHYVIDTTDMLPQALRTQLRQIFYTGEQREGLAVTVYSFGFKHGAALDADMVIDVRFLPNPYYDPELRPLAGLDAPVRDFVMFRQETEEFLGRWKALLDVLMPGYVKEGKQQLAIAVGCTGGQHRSVALAEATGDYLKSMGYRVSVAHRDLKLAEK